MKLVIGINGHGQSSRTNTGVGKLLGKIKAQDPEVETRLFGWRTGAETLAKWIASLDLESIYIVGYSYGLYTGVLLCRALRMHGIRVDYLFSIDGVFRLRDHWGSWKSLWDCWAILIPVNVRRVIGWRQRVNKPSGHRLITNPVYTTQDSRPLFVRHAEADDQETVHQTILGII